MHMGDDDEDVMREEEEMRRNVEIVERMCGEDDGIQSMAVLGTLVDLRCEFVDVVNFHY